MVSRPREPRGRKPIADTYEELQALQYIDGAFNALKTELGEACPHNVSEGAVSAAVLLILIRVNIELEKLDTHDTANQLTPAFGTLSRVAPWIGASCLLATEVLEQEKAHNFSKNNCLNFRIEVERLKKNYSLLTHFCEKNGIFESVSIGLESEAPDHRIELLVRDLSLAAHRLEAAAFLCNQVSGCLQPSRLIEQLNLAAHGGNVASDGDNLLDFFRLFHQVPELLGRSAIHLIDARLLDDSQSAEEITNNLPLLISHVKSIRRCLLPLISLMTPVEYYKIRHQLGTTSGSHSKVLARTGLLRTRLERLAARLSSLSRTRNPRLFLLFDELNSNIIGWRRDHLFFPRFLLGSGGTASLSRAPDGLENCRSMGASIHQRINRLDGQDVTVQAPGHEAALDTMDDWCLSLGGRLSSIVGEVARSKFDYVQIDIKTQKK